MVYVGAASRTLWSAAREEMDGVLDADSSSDAYFGLLSVADEKLKARAPLLALVDKALILPDAVF